jgi:hypothetical protein
MLVAIAQHLPIDPAKTQAARASDAHAHILGPLNDAIGFVQTACSALEADDKTAFAIPSLRLGLDMLNHVYTTLDEASPGRPTITPTPRVTAAPRVVAGASRATRAHRASRTRRKRKRAP